MSAGSRVKKSARLDFVRSRYIGPIGSESEVNFLIQIQGIYPRHPKVLHRIPMAYPEGAKRENKVNPRDSQRWPADIRRHTKKAKGTRFIFTNLPTNRPNGRYVTRCFSMQGINKTCLLNLVKLGRSARAD